MLLSSRNALVENYVVLPASTDSNKRGRVGVCETEVHRLYHSQCAKVYFLLTIPPEPSYLDTVQHPNNTLRLLGLTTWVVTVIRLSLISPGTLGTE